MEWNENFTWTVDNTTLDYEVTYEEMPELVEQQDILDYWLDPNNADQSS